jgi:hypothetical protein
MEGLVMIILYTLVGLSAVLPLTLGMFVLYHLVLRAKNPPCDESNRINHIRLFWFALTREDKFVEAFPWLRNDEWENMDA